MRSRCSCSGSCNVETDVFCFSLLLSTAGCSNSLGTISHSCSRSSGFFRSFITQLTTLNLPSESSTAWPLEHSATFCNRCHVLEVLRRRLKLMHPCHSKFFSWPQLFDQTVESCHQSSRTSSVRAPPHVAQPQATMYSLHLRSMKQSPHSRFDGALRVQGLNFFNPDFFQSGLKRLRY